MRQVIKLLLLGFAGYAVVTASPSDKLAMRDGAKAVFSAFRDACTRPVSPCTLIVDQLRDVVEHAPSAAEPSAVAELEKRPPRRELDETPRSWRN